MKKNQHIKTKSFWKMTFMFKTYKLSKTKQNKTKTTDGNSSCSINFIRRLKSTVWFPVGVLSSSTERSSECVEALQPAVREEAVRLDLVAAASCGTEVGQHGLVLLPLRRLPPVFLVVIPLRTDKIKLVFILRWLAFCLFRLKDLHGS